MNIQRIMVMLLLPAIGLLSGCATTYLWDSGRGPGAYREGDVERQSVEAFYLLRSSEGATFLVPGHPDEQSMFTMTVPKYSRDLDRFTENFTTADNSFSLRKMEIAVGLYDGNGYRIDVEFTSRLPVDRVVELFGGTGITTENDYRKAPAGEHPNFKIHYRGITGFMADSLPEVSHYTYSMSDNQAVVRTGLLPVSDEYGLLAQSRFIELNGGNNFKYVVYEYRHENETPFLIKAAATPGTVVLDAATIAVGVPAAIVILMMIGMSQ